MSKNELSSEEKFITDEMRAASDISTDIDLSGEIMKNIRAMEKVGDKPSVQNPFRWSFAITFAGLFFIIMISFTFIFFNKEFKSNPKENNNRILINSVEIEGREAKKFFYNSGNKNRVVIWAQKYSEG